MPGKGYSLEQFQEKWEPVFCPELRKIKEIEHFRDSEKNGNALGARLLEKRHEQAIDLDFVDTCSESRTSALRHLVHCRSETTR